jgi:tRNA A-37 threonylcarbamoyl transferase component Bud32
VMLTESRHAKSVAEAGLLREPARAGTTLNAEVRDPGGDLLAGHQPSEELAARPRTRLAALAIAARQKSGPEEKHGVLLDPYRNYRGVEVIGAWRWLDSYDMGVALEIERDEGYAPLRNLDRAFTVVLALAILTALLILYSTVGAVRERLRFGRVRRIGRYTLQERIGEGGMSQVYTGRHALLKRPIAIKVLKRQATDELIKRFEREAQLASRLSHPNTVEIYDYGHTGAGEIYYVMEYVDGVTLSELVDREGALPAGRIVYLLRQVCSAIGHAHGQGVLHRDIKPENIMACVRGGEHDVVKILDFGLVKNLHEKATRDITQSVLRVLGTPVYMSPERFSDPAAADVRGDVYSIGAVAYLLASGRRLFDGVQGDDLQFQILHSVPVRPSELRAGPLPKGLEALILKCLEKRLEDRPQDVAELLERLRELALEHPWSERDAAAAWSRYAAREPAEA